MRITCKIAGATDTGHQIEYGLCVRCRETSSDASEFDFIRAWYSRLGEKTVSAEDISSEVGEGQLPNVYTKDGSAAVSTDKFLKTLVNGAVVMNDDHTIVDAVDLPDGTYRTVARRDGADTLIRQAE